MSTPARALPDLTVASRHPLIGAAVHGVGLARPLDDATFDALHALWMEHLLLIFPDQPISDEEIPSPHTMVNVVDMDPDAGRALPDTLVEHATQDRFVYRHRWRPHDVIMWDDRCTMHSVQPFDNARVRRVMHRVTLVGDGPPIAVDRVAGRAAEAGAA